MCAPVLASREGVESRSAVTLRGSSRRHRLRRFVADLADFAEQFGHLHAGKRFEERGNLRRNLRHVSGKFVRAGGIAIAGGYDGHLVYFRKRLAERANHFRQSGDEFVEHGGLVVFLERLRLDVHRLRFGLTLPEDDLRFGFTACTDRRSLTFGFADQALAFGAGDGFHALALDFRRLQHSCDQLALAALDFRILHFHLSFTLDLLHFYRLGDHALLHHVGLDLVGFVGGGLRLLGHFEIRGLLQVEVAFRFGLLRERSGFRRDAFLIGLRLSNGRGACGFRTLDGDVAFGFGGRHFGVTADACDVRTAHIGDVFVFVAHLFNREADYFEALLGHVAGVGGAHAVGNHLRLFDDLFDRELADDAAEVTLHHQADEDFALLGALGEELFGRGANRHGIGLHFDLRDGFDGDRYALLRVETLLGRDVKRHQLEREFLARLHHRPNDGAAALHDPRFGSGSVDDQRFVRAYFPVHPRERRHEENDGEDQKTANDWNQRIAVHTTLPFTFGDCSLVRQSSKLVVRSRRCRRSVRLLDEFGELAPAVDVSDAVLVAFGDDFRAAFERLAVVRARARAFSYAALEIDDFAGAVFADRNGYGGDDAFRAVVFVAHVRTFFVHQLHHEAEHDPRGAEAGQRGERERYDGEHRRVRGEDVADAAEPSEEGEHRGCVEPRKVAAASLLRATVAGWRVCSGCAVRAEVQIGIMSTKVPTVRPVQVERQVDVHRSGEKRKQAERETHDKAAEIQVGPGHCALPHARTHAARLTSYRELLLRGPG